MNKLLLIASLTSLSALGFATEQAHADCPSGRAAVIEVPRAGVSKDADLRLRKNCNSIAKEFSGLGNLEFSGICYQSKSSIKAQISYADNDEKENVIIRTSTVWLRPIGIPVDARTVFHISGARRGTFITKEIIFPGTESIAVIPGTGTQDFSGVTSNGNGFANPTTAGDGFPPDAVTITSLNLPVCLSR